MAVFDSFPYLKDDKIIIRMMDEKDLSALREITGSDEVYKYCPLFLYKKSDRSLLTAIRNLAGRDFEKRKLIIAGIYLANDAGKLIGLAEMFDYHKRDNCMTIGYMINPKYWHLGFASHAVSLMKEYLFMDGELSKTHAFVMPENIYSEKVLLKNGFEKLPEQVEQKNWGGMETVITDYFQLVCKV